GDRDRLQRGDVRRHPEKAAPNLLPVRSFHGVGPEDEPDVFRHVATLHANDNHFAWTNRGRIGEIGEGRRWTPGEGKDPVTRTKPGPCRRSVRLNLADRV